MRFLEISRRFIVSALFLVSSGHILAQTRYLTFGTGATPMVLSGDYRALGWNPAQMTFSPLNKPEWKSAAGGIEFGARLSSSVFERSEIWDDLLNRNNDEASSWTTEQWNDYADLLGNESFALNVDILTAATAKQWRNWAFAYSNTQHIQGEAYFDQQPIDLLVQGGSSNWINAFDLLLTASGDTIPNTGDFTLDELMSFIGGIELDGDAIIGNILQDTRLGFSWHRSHSMGISKAWKIGEIALHTGISGRLLLGNGYFSIQNTDGELDAFGAFSNGFGFDQLATLDPGSANLTDVARLWGPVGQGWGLDIGGVVEFSDGIWVSAAVSDLGQMEWRGERYSFATSLGSWQTPVVNPENMAEILIGAMTPSTWFEAAETETRIVPNGATFQLGAGIKLSKLLLLAGEVAFDNPELLGNSGTRMGVSAVFQPVPLLRLDVGLSKWGDETYRVPGGLMIRTGQRGFECGIQATDIQALWKTSQPEIGFRAVAMRWVW